MAARNTRVTVKILHALRHGPPDQDSLQRLEAHFKNDLLAAVGNTRTVARFAKKLRLHITPAERTVILEYLAKRIRVTIDHVETAINTVFVQDRFIEP